MLVSRKKILAKFGSRCAYCGKPLTLRTMRRDHVTPLVRFRGQRYSFSGRNGCVNPEAHNLDNIVPACDPCNTDKGPLDLETWRGSLRWLGYANGIRFWFEKFNDVPVSRKATGNPNTR